MEEIIFRKSVTTYLTKLVDILFEKGYFSYKASSQEYVNKLYDSIYNDLPLITHHETPQELSTHGNYYVKIKGSKRTTWYVFFEKSNSRYIIKFVTNNHMPDSAYFNKL